MARLTKTRPDVATAKAVGVERWTMRITCIPMHALARALALKQTLALPP